MARLKPAPVTPAGVRDGDTGALAGVTERRGPAVYAYCRQVSEPGRELDAAAEALAGFRAAVSRADDPWQLDPDSLLLSLTRHAAAARAPRPAERAPLAPLRFARRSGQSPCQVMPELLVARAERTLSAADVGRLARHLERCPRCPSIAERFRAAERAYREEPSDELPEEVADRLFEALASAVPVSASHPDPDGDSSPSPSAGAGLEPGTEHVPTLTPPEHPPEEPGLEPPPAPAYADVEPSVLDQRPAGHHDTPNGAGALIDEEMEPPPVEHDEDPETALYPFNDPHDDSAAKAHAGPAANGYARPVLVGQRSGWGWRWALPAGVLAVALGAALALAGVFSSGANKSLHRPPAGTAAPAGGTPASQSGTGGTLAHSRSHHHHHHLLAAGTTHHHHHTSALTHHHRLTTGAPPTLTPSTRSPRPASPPVHHHHRATPAPTSSAGPGGTPAPTHP